MTTLIAPASVAEGLRMLAHLVATTTIPAPREVTYCVLADNDTDGTAVIDRVGLALEHAGIKHQVNDTDHSRELTIPLADGFDYRIFYIYRSEMAAYRANRSYDDNIRLTVVDR